MRRGDLSISSSDQVRVESSSRRRCRNGFVGFMPVILHKDRSGQGQFPERGFAPTVLSVDRVVAHQYGFNG